MTGGLEIAEQADRPATIITPSPSRQLVGRAGLLATIEHHLATNTSAVLTGPSGIGKTALVDAAGSEALIRGELVLRTAGVETQRWISLSGLADLISQVPSELGEALPEPQRGAIEDLLRGDHDGGRTTSVQFACRLAWQALLDHCAAKQPTLLLIDDAQWIDAASMEIIAYSLRRLNGRDIRAVVAGNCPEQHEISHAGRRCPWLPPRAATELRVPPMATDDLAELLDLYGLPARIASKIHADSGGNPYLALALGGAFTDRVPRAGRPVPLPQRVHSLISERIRDLPHEARETLLVAALAGRPTLELLRRAGRDTAKHDIGLAAEAGLLTVEGGALRFTPPSVTTVVAESAGAAHRARIHTVLSTVVLDVAHRARHRALAAGNPDAELAGSLVTAAETARGRGARRLAAELYLLAADRTPPGHDAEHLEWLTVAAEVGATAGAPEIVHRAANAVLAADTDRAQRVRARIALLDLSCQALAEMDEMFAAALVDAEGVPELEAPLRLRLSWAALLHGQPARCEDEADRTSALAQTVDDTTTEAMALSMKATAARVMGRRNYREPLDRALKLPHQTLEGWLHMAPGFTATRFAVFDDRLDEARTELLRTLAVVEHGSGEEIVQILRSLSEVSARLGRCRDALDYAERAITISDVAGLSPGPPWYDAAVAELAGGSVSRAANFAQRGIRASEQEGDGIYLGRHLHVLGQARLRAGDAGGAVAVLRRAEALEREQGVAAPLVLRWHSDLAAGLASLGELDESRRVIDTTWRAVRREPHGGATVSAQLDRAEAALLAGHGDVDAAIELLGRAADRFERLAEPIERGHCLLVRGGFERRRRRNAAGRAAMEEALDVFTRCDAKPWMEQACRALNQVGSDPDVARVGRVTRNVRDPADALASLTNAEERIALLVGEGASNREVAARMYLSVKTIEAALTRIYRKLGVRSRTQLSSWLRTSPNRSWG